MKTAKSALRKSCHLPRRPRLPYFTDRSPASGAVPPGRREPPEGGGSVTRVPGRRGSSRAAAARRPRLRRRLPLSPHSVASTQGTGERPPRSETRAQLTCLAATSAPQQVRLRAGSSQRAAALVRTRGPQSRRPRGMLGAVVSRKD